MVKDILRKAESCGTDVVLYGAGKYGKIALHNINKKYPEINIRCFIDDDLSRNNRDIEHISVISLNEAINVLGKEIIIVISNYYITDTLQKIENAGIELSRVIFNNEIMIEPIETSYIKKKQEEISKVYTFLEDYESKLIYKTMIECRITHNIDTLSRTCRENQYFPSDIFQIKDDEVFIDGGAFDGDTIDAFLSITNNKFKYIYAFEPDKQNFRKLTNKHKDKNIKMFNIGLYNENKKVAFSACKGGSSSVEAIGKEEIEVCSFDQLQVPDHKVTFIKMDIEGSELNALQGMTETIRRYTPKLAICIYHKFQDIWEIPLFIKQLNPNYKIYIRNYTTYLDEIVLYAIIK